MRGFLNHHKNYHHDVTISDANALVISPKHTHYGLRVMHHQLKDIAMNEKEIYKQKHQAQLDEWKADMAKLKAKASGAQADAQLAMNKHIDALDHKLKNAQAKLSVLSEASEDAWGSLKNGMESAWESLKTAVHEAALRYKN